MHICTENTPHPEAGLFRRTRPSPPGGELKDKPLFTVERGAPDATELAALTAVLLARVRAPHTPAAARAGAGPARSPWPRSAFRAPGTWR
ncbi:acyl-CoA carboxylase epsilon subunit [Streptomyces spiramyceticus]|uniref:acyl-CoA carboxylase epsilon subunit n=1 Tax=Streptomyces spiramyceticus TaxID=299717 RepID=UPI00237C50D1|nr:acyl-CoA carboxylase epsilon subunit [Streptomyces spiramyceticus]